MSMTSISCHFRKQS